MKQRLNFGFVEDDVHVVAIAESSAVGIVGIGLLHVNLIGLLGRAVKAGVGDAGASGGQQGDCSNGNKF